MCLVKEIASRVNTPWIYSLATSSSTFLQKLRCHFNIIKDFEFTVDLIPSIYTMSSETTHYNVYRIIASQSHGPDHVGLALVPAQMPDQNAGRFYHVIGNVGMGMEYQKRGRFDFSREPTYKSKFYLFKIKRESLQDWERICKGTQAPFDPRVLTERNIVPPPPDCASWVDEVTQEAMALAVEGENEVSSST
jgi:hypothetical protein